MVDRQVKCVFVSVWDGGIAVESDALFDIDTGIVSDIQTANLPEGILNELEHLQVMINHYLESIDYKHDDIVIDNIEEKIFELNEEIDRIINTDPYMYKYLLSDPDEVKEKKEDLKKEISDFLNYADELDKVIAGFHIERSFS